MQKIFTYKYKNLKYIVWCVILGMMYGIQTVVILAFPCIFCTPTMSKLGYRQPSARPGIVD